MKIGKDVTINTLMASDKYEPLEKVAMLNTYEESFKKVFNFYVNDIDYNKKGIATKSGILENNFGKYEKSALCDALNTNLEKRFEKFHAGVHDSYERIAVLMAMQDRMYSKDE
jgi:hypothetical protein|tara:strand:- start:37031 stop:37369 length:339 start_codon:yes stop_codon:yes gene_type:complete